MLKKVYNPFIDKSEWHETMEGMLEAASNTPNILDWNNVVEDCFIWNLTVHDQICNIKGKLEGDALLWWYNVEVHLK